MPREFIFGNGGLTLLLDSTGRIRDLYFPFPGSPNHLNGYAISYGVFVDGQLSWLHEPSWNRKLSANPLTGAGHTSFESSVLQLRVERTINIPFKFRLEESWEVHDHSGRERSVKLFVHEDLRIDETDVGDTTLYVPQLDALVHFKNGTAIAFRGESESGGMTQYTCGIKGFGGAEGTWRDAEDGHLSMNPIAQGSVDCTYGLEMLVPGFGTSKASTTLVAFFDHSRNIVDSLKHVLKPELREIAESDSIGIATLSNLPEHLQNLAAVSLRVLKSHSAMGGLAVAALDSDIMETNRANYAYFWPRDAAHIGLSFASFGLEHKLNDCLLAASRLTSKDRPAFLQKYTAAGHLGATWHPWIYDGIAEIPIQEDGTALMLLAGCHEAFYPSDDPEPDLNARQEFLKRMADFLVEFRDPETGLSKPSYDLWEERRGIHTNTVAAVVAGLRAYADLSLKFDLGDPGPYADAAAQMVDGLRKHMTDPELGTIYRMIQIRHGEKHVDPTCDSACLQLITLGVLDPFEPLAEQILKQVQTQLWVESPIGGLARYEGDYYFRRSDQFPGNPWIITTMWLAQVQILRAKALADLEEPKKLLEWVCERASSTGMLAEQYHPVTGEPLSVQPLAWSHAEFLATAKLWSDKRATFKDS